jgi:hypothetical protein
MTRPAVTIQPIQRQGQFAGAVRAFLPMLATACTLLATPSPTRALDFNDESSATNPFFFNGGSSSSAWVLKLDGDPETFTTCNDPQDTCVRLISENAVTIVGSGDASSATTWTSSLGSLGPADGYTISFKAYLSAEGEGGGDVVTGSLAINNIITPLSKSSATPTFISSQLLGPSSRLVFTINNGTNAYGDIEITEFSATRINAVPAPLPLLGAAAAFARLRRLQRLSNRLKHASRSTIALVETQQGPAQRP